MATGDTLLILIPEGNEQPATDYATFDVRNGHLVLDFDDTTEEAAIFTFLLPRNYAGGGITLAIHYAVTSAITGVAGWKTDIERIGDAGQDIDSDGFTGSPQTGSATIPGTSGVVDVIEIPHTSGAQMDSLAAGELGRIKISRDVAVGSNAAGDLELVAIEIRET